MRRHRRAIALTLTGVHPDRPLLCRMFGTVDDPKLTCRHGRGPRRKLSAGEADEIALAYFELVTDDADLTGSWPVTGAPWAGDG